MSKNKDLAKDYFDRHPLSNECHITSDGRVFHNSGAAQGYATNLKDREIEKFERDQKKQDDNTSDDAVITLVDFDPEVTTYAQAKALVKELKLETPSQSKDDLFKALTEEKAKTQE